jgi:hypothetical protein
MKPRRKSNQKFVEVEQILGFWAKMQNFIEAM